MRVCPTSGPPEEARREHRCLARSPQDADADGVLDFDYTLQWSAEGNLAQTGWRTSEGGTVSTTYADDAEGRQVSTSTDHTTDGADDDWSTITLSCP